MRRKKKIAIIGTVGVPAKYGGFETLVHHLVLHLADSFNLHVYNSSKAYEKAERSKYWKNARVHYLPFNANGLSSIWYDIISMIHALFYADIILVLGVSGGIFIPFIRIFSRKKIVVNIDGLEWRRDKWHPLAKRFLKFSEFLAVKFSHADITDNKMIKRYAAIFYKSLSHLIAYGADHCKPLAMDKSLKSEYPFIGFPYAFKVARIEPENNIHMVVEAFADMPHKNLVIVGNWQNSTYGIELKDKYSKFNNIYMLDPIYDQRRLDMLRSNCFIYIHGHSAGGTNPSLVEAMYLGLPVMAFHASYNVATTHNAALYFGSVSELKKLLNNQRLNALRSMGSKMNHIAQRHYLWEIIAMKYGNIFHSFDYKYVKKKIDARVSLLDNRILLENKLSHLSYVKPFYE